MPEINPDLLTRPWTAVWCRHPDGPRHQSAVFLFRKCLTLETPPGRFVVHVTADQRHRLLVNGVPVGWGPARGDTTHWRYETFDLAPYLRPGENVLAAVVHWFGQESAPVAQVTVEAGFLMQGDTDAESAVNTPEGWKVWHDAAYSFTMDDANALWTYCVVGPSEKFDGRAHPWGWLQSGFDDADWKDALRFARAAPYGLENAETHWWLVPRSIPAMEETPQRFARAVRTQGIELPEGWPAESRPLTIPANSRVSIVLDNGHETCAFPEILASGGRGATIRLAYTEALVDGSLKPNDPKRKGNRDEVGDRVVRGYADTWILDGGSDRLLRPLWWKTYRYAELTVETADEPVLLSDLRGVYTGYPFELRATFDAPEMGDAAKLWEIGWRTARLCAHETYMDCPYYEQLQYIGDTRIQCLVSLYASGDHRLFQNALSQMDDSRHPNGLTMSRYPSRIPQIIPPFSLWYVCMAHDYFRHVNLADDFLRGLLPGIRGVLEWFGARQRPDGLLGPLAFWNFVDWASEWPMGVPPGAREGGSSVVSLQYALALDAANELELELDNAEPDAKEMRRLIYRTDALLERADDIRKAVRSECFDPKTLRVADTPDKISYSQHAAILAVLADAVPEKQQRAVMERVLEDTELTQATFYFRFYLNRALVKAGLGDRYLDTLGPWRDMLKMGLTTWAEKPEPTRSDCHAWSASPNYEFLATVLGINPGGEGFGVVRIAPHLGDLLEAAGSVPHPMGDIAVAYRREGETLHAEIMLPPGLPGGIHWRGEQRTLMPGAHRITLNGA
jgi:alpha-L-rhamnosidase